MAELLHGNFIGTVMKVDKDSRKLAVYIPKLMPALYNGDAKEQQFPTNNGLEINNITTNISSTVNKINYIWVNPKDKETPLPDVGSKVLVVFLDGSPSFSYWEKWNMNGDWSTIPEEKYKQLFTMESGGRVIDVDEDDMVVMKFPESFSITSSTVDKVKTLSVNENYDFYKSGTVSKVISDLQKSMEYLEKSTKDAFVTALEQYTIMTSRPTRGNTETWPKPASFDKTTPAGYMKAIASTVDGNYTYYSTTAFYDIADDMKPYYDKLTAFGEDKELTDNEKAQCDVILDEAITLLNKKYYSNVNQGIYDGFEDAKKTLVEDVRTSDNLLACDAKYKYGKTVLGGLKDIYTAYTKYKVKFDGLTNKETLPVTEKSLNVSIRTAFEQVLAIANDNMSATNFILYMKDMFPEKVKVYFAYSEDGVDITRQNKEVCDVFGTFGEGWDNIVDTTKLCPILTIPDNQTLGRSSFVFVGWKDYETGATLSENYSPVQTVIAEPQFLGCYVLIDNETGEQRFYIKNDLNSTTTLKADGKSTQSSVIDSNLDNYKTIEISDGTHTATINAIESEDSVGNVTYTWA